MAEEEDTTATIEITVEADLVRVVVTCPGDPEPAGVMFTLDPAMSEAMALKLMAGARQAIIQGAIDRIGKGEL